MAQATGRAVSAAMRETGGPLRGDPVSELLMAQLADPEINPPARPWATADLGPKTTTYRFRSKPGYRLLGFHIPVPSDTEDEDRAAHEQKRFKLKVKDINDRNRLVRMAERYGSRHLNFTPVSGKFECWFATDDVELAAWLRAQPEFGDRFYEEMGPIPLDLGDGRIINVVPQTDADRQALAAARAAA